MQKLDSLPLFDSKAQRPLRLLLSSAFEVEEDNQGRIRLPDNLIKFAKIEKNLIIFKGPECIEIWSEKVWDEYDVYTKR